MITPLYVLLKSGVAVLVINASVPVRPWVILWILIPFGEKCVRTFSTEPKNEWHIDMDYPKKICGNDKIRTIRTMTNLGAFHISVDLLESPRDGSRTPRCFGRSARGTPQSRSVPHVLGGQRVRPLGPDLYGAPGVNPMPSTSLYHTFTAAVWLGIWIAMDSFNNFLLITFVEPESLM